MAGIFINYRQDDSKGFAVALQQKLVHYFGNDQVFMDVGSIKAGSNFANAIVASMKGCNVCLVLIAKVWTNATDAAGGRQLHQATDWVRQEIETALKRGITVIPVLLDGTAVPQKSHLPPSLHGLLDLQMVPLSLKRFGPETDELAEELAGIVPARRPFASTHPASAPRATGSTEWQFSLKKRKKRWFVLEMARLNEVHTPEVWTWDQLKVKLDGNKFDREVGWTGKRTACNFQLSGKKCRVKWQESLLSGIKVIEVTIDKKHVFAEI